MIVTTNGTYNWLIERGIRPAAQVMVDSRPFMKRFTEPHIGSCKYLMASQVDNEIVAILPKDQTYLWHCGDSDLVKDAVDKWTADNETNREWWPVYGGTTVVLRALPLLAMLGFRKVEAFGWDSCLMDGKHHSYAQPENDGGIVFPVMVGGETFACNPWMIVQANESGKVVRSILGKIDGFEMADSREMGLFLTCSKPLPIYLKRKKMAASAWRAYNEAKKYLLTADLDLNAATMRIKLVKGTAAANVSAYTRSTFASITGLPSNTSRTATSPTNVLPAAVRSPSCR